MGDPRKFLSHQHTKEPFSKQNSQQLVRQSSRPENRLSTVANQPEATTDINVSQIQIADSNTLVNPSIITRPRMKPSATVSEQAVMKQISTMAEGAQSRGTQVRRKEGQWEDRGL